jgi:hypothetical protein
MTYTKENQEENIRIHVLPRQKSVGEGEHLIFFNRFKMESEEYFIPSLRDIEKSLLDLSSKIRIQSAFLGCHIEKMEEDDTVEYIMSESEAEKVLARTGSLKDELEKFKLNLKKFQEVTKQKRNSSKYILHRFRNNYEGGFFCLFVFFLISKHKLQIMSQMLIMNSLGVS